MWRMYVKEITDALRDRRTLVLTFLIPIFTMSALVLFYESMISDNSDETYQVAVLKSEMKEMEQVFAGVDQVELSKVNDVGDIRTGVEEGEYKLGIITSGFSIDSLAEEGIQEITLHGDSTSTDTSTLMSLVENQFNVLEQQYVEERLTSNGVNSSVLEAIVVNAESVEYNSDNLTATLMLAYLLPMLVSISVATGAMPISADIIAGEKERKTLEALLMTPVSRSKVLISKWLTVSTIGFLAGVTSLTIVVVETFFFTDNLQEALTFEDNLGFIILSFVLLAIGFGMFIGAILIVISILSKTVKEMNSYASPVIMITVAPTFFLMSRGANEVATIDFVVPFMSIYMILKELLLGITDFTHIGLALGSTLLYGIIIIFIGRVLFHKDRWVVSS